MRAAAGYPVCEDGSDEDTVYDLAELGVRGDGEFVDAEFAEKGDTVVAEAHEEEVGYQGDWGKGVVVGLEQARNPHVVMMEAGERERERYRLFQKRLGRDVSGVSPPSMLL